LNFSEEENRRFSSKHPVEFLYFLNNKSSFIYLDYGKFTIKPNGKFFIEYSEQGRFSYHDRIKDRIYEGTHIFMYTNGLSHLMENKLSLNDIVKRTCVCCGNYTDSELLDCDGVAYCRNCFEKNVYFCEECHIPIPKRSENRYRVVNSKIILCKECFEKNYTTCNICNKHKRKTEVTFVRERALNFCKECLEEEGIEFLVRCDTCHEANEEPANNSFEVLYNGTTMCKICLLKENDKKQLFLDFPPATELRIFRNRIIFQSHPIEQEQPEIDYERLGIRRSSELELMQRSPAPRFAEIPLPPPEIQEQAPEPTHNQTGQAPTQGTNPYYNIHFNNNQTTSAVTFEWPTIGTIGTIGFGRIPSRQELQEDAIEPVRQVNPIPFPWEIPENRNENFLPEDIQHDDGGNPDDEPEEDYDEEDNPDDYDDDGDDQN
jgi:hypothetical protein